MHLSVQCWTLRDELNENAAFTFEALKEMGLSYVELAGTAQHTPEEFAQIIENAGLKVSGMHVGLDRLENDLSGLVQEAKLFGTDNIILPWVSEDAYRNGWANFGKNLEIIAGALVESGITFSYHNHVFEFDPAEDSCGFDILFGTTSPALIHAQIDLWWAHCGGRNLPELIHQFAGRMPTVHLKDGTECANDVHQPIGKGTIDWIPVLQACIDAGIKFGVIELDRSPGSALEAVAQSYAQLKEWGLS